MCSRIFLIAALKFAGGKKEVMSTLRLTILFAESFGQWNRRVSPSLLKVLKFTKCICNESNASGDQNSFLAANFKEDRRKDRLLENGLW